MNACLRACACPIALLTLQRMKNAKHMDKAQYTQTKIIQLNWFAHLNDNSLERVLKDSPNTPDIVVDDLLKTIVILEVCCCFDMYMDLCFSEFFF